MLALRSRIEVPVIGSGISIGGEAAAAIPLNHPRWKGLVLPPRHEADEAVVAARFDGIDPGVDLAEPFDRIREAIAEARKMGVANRAA